jgi:hypothetical protein
MKGLSSTSAVLRHLAGRQMGCLRRRLVVVVALNVLFVSELSC